MVFSLGIVSYNHVHKWNRTPSKTEMQFFILAFLCASEYLTPFFSLKTEAYQCFRNEITTGFI